MGEGPYLVRAEPEYGAAVECVRLAAERNGPLATGDT
jgi:hypothetical protein